ncbi:MAG TPA: farnesyl diphosphate synthase [Gemmatimonadaceae bacterium]|jgi:geranylgeranyl pyrophosphate synthase
MGVSTSSNASSTAHGAAVVHDATSATTRPDRAAIEDALVRVCDRVGDALGADVSQAVRYSVLGGGKRLRGLLLLAAYRTAGGQGDASALAAAVEIVHAYSLVHDDLPCMDNDDMRRGRPTVHRQFGVRLATAAGVAMVPLAARAALHAAQDLGLDERASSDVVRELMHASGASGMIAGQLLDLEGEGRPLTLEELERIHRAKTGALIRASVVLGGIGARAGVEQVNALATFGEAIGLAFQIADDVLDVTATTDRLGKTAGRDIDLQKSTYPALLGVDGASRRADALVADGCAALRAAGLLSTELDALARFVVERES